MKITFMSAAKLFIAVITCGSLITGCQTASKPNASQHAEQRNHYLMTSLASNAATGLGKFLGHKPKQTKHDGAPKNYNIDVSKIPNAIPKVEPRSRYGNPPQYAIEGKVYHVMRAADGFKQTGIASWYGTKFHDRRTSSGEPYNMFAMTAAHKTLPLPSYVRVTNLENKRQIIVKVNDRGPFRKNRIIDLSYVAAKKLGILKHGTGLVEIDVIDPKHPTTSGQPLHPMNHKPKMYLQIGAFSEYSNAKRLAKKIKYVVGEPIQIKSAHGKQHPIYRVQIGPLADVDLTDSLYEKLQKAGIGDAITVIQ